MDQTAWQVQTVKREQETETAKKEETVQNVQAVQKAEKFQAAPMDERKRSKAARIRIFVSHTPDSSNVRIYHPLFTHVMAGSDFQTLPLAQDMQPDNTGDHISYKNRTYCELTVQYWAWKNVMADYYGFCHYRRYFSFASRPLPEADCGCPVYPYLDARTQKKLCLEEAVRSIEPYDFLIAQGIPVRALFAKDVYSHYKNAPGLHEKDLALFLRILCRKYPQMRTAAQTYVRGKIFYPCSMFIMKRELFMEYARMLFDILEEFERRADMRTYSREGRRTPGHLGERFAGIYYEYIRQQGRFRTGELQMVMFMHTQLSGPEEAQAGKKQTEAQRNVQHKAVSGLQEAHPRHTIPKQQDIPVVLAAGQSYAPVLFTCLRSLIQCTGPGRNYHIYIFHTDMHAETMRIFREAFTRANVCIDFIDVGARIAGYRLRAKEHITAETYYRFLIPDILRHEPKVIYLDADLILCRDIADLYDLPLGNSLLAAVPDPDFIGQYNGANPDTRRYAKEVLGLKNPYGYVQAGVLVLNVRALRQRASVRKLFSMAERGDYKYSDQDILNIVCQGRIKPLDMAWNVLADSNGRLDQVIRYAPARLLEEYERAREHPYIIHYAGSRKPWKYPGGDFAQEFWKTARGTPYYEALVGQMAAAGRSGQGMFLDKAVDAVRRAAKKILPQGSGVRRAVVSLYWKLK